MIPDIFVCCYGRTIGLIDDNEPCPDAARKGLVLHPPGGDGVAWVGQLCDRHFVLVQAATDPHAEPEVPGD